MKLPEFKVGDAVMLQTGGKHLAITNIDRASQSATCVRSHDRDGVFETMLPLRCLIRLSEPTTSLSAGDYVTYRPTWAYFSVVKFDKKTGMATCAGKASLEKTMHVSRLVRMHLPYE